MVRKAGEALSQADYEALATLRYTLRKFMDFSTSAANDEGLPPQQHQALLAIKGNPEGGAMTIGMLAERLIIAPHTATELVGRLIEAGYVSRHPDPSDKRRQTLQLTGKSEDILHRLSAIHLREIREMAPRLIEVLTQLQTGESDE
ncbi:MAG: MarR family transcriptional regulator [Rhizobiaceae bacterium]|nr:MarR family transcriptional regulator [Rhizobiaceae bacterium]